jgi:hypothetical protein
VPRADCTPYEISGLDVLVPTMTLAFDGAVEALKVGIVCGQRMLVSRFPTHAGRHSRQQ